MAGNVKNTNMGIAEICEEIMRLYEEPIDGNQDSYLAVQLVHKLRMEISKESLTEESLLDVLEITRKIATSKKKLKQILEKELLSLISYLPHKLWVEREGENRPKFERGNEKRESKIANYLVRFAKEIYEIKIDRDAFSGKRRGYAVQILESVSSYFDVPEFMELCTRSIKSKSKNEFIESIESLKNYCLENEKIPSEEILELVDKRIAKTKNRTEAVCGLNLQVETGVISEFEALSRIDEWKEKNYRW